MTEQQIAALLASVGRLAVAQERMADAYEEMLAMQKKKTTAPATSSSSEKRERGPKGDVLTVTGRVLNFGIARGAGGIPLLTKEKKKEYWRLKLDTGFEASVFRESYAAVCSEAFDRGIPLVVSYVVAGKYNNIEGVELGAATAGQQGKPRADYDDSAESGPF